MTNKDEIENVIDILNRYIAVKNDVNHKIIHKEPHIEAVNLHTTLIAELGRDAEIILNVVQSFRNENKRLRDALEKANKGRAKTMMLVEIAPGIEVFMTANQKTDWEKLK